MEGERRKRKLESNEEESEEEKLEKFYALIRSTKDVRDSLQANTKDKADRKDDFMEKDKGIWKPTFQPEDFNDDYQQDCFRSTHLSSNPSAPSTSAKHDDVARVADKQPPPQATVPAPPPPQVEDDDDEKANDHLDLNLSL